MCLDDAISVMKDHVEGLESPSLDSSLLHVPPEDFISESIPVRLSSSSSLSLPFPLHSPPSPFILLSSPLFSFSLFPSLPPFYLSLLLLPLSSPSPSLFLPSPSLLLFSLSSPTFLLFSLLSKEISYICRA